MNWLKYKNIYFLFSGILVLLSVYGLVFYKLPLGLDFTGGTIWEFKFEEDHDTSEMSQYLKDNEIESSSIQRSSDGSYLIKLDLLNSEEISRVETLLTSEPYIGESLRYETVGPSIGPELVKKTVYALSLSSMLILLWIAYQFKSIKYGLSAILAMLHDTFILVGAFAIFGRFFTAEVDFLFVTALLTTLSFSVHDTIVVFDRIRELLGKGNTKSEIHEVANRALTETMVRSINNSFTIIFMLTALLLLGGATIRWFAAALLIGTILGTYSSPFVAVPLLVTFDKLKLKKS